MDGSTGCAYRGDNGLSCAVGCLIPDDEYLSDMECLSVSELTDEFTSVKLSKHLSKFLTRNQDLLMDLQALHDSILPHNWPNRLAQIAERYNLIP
jgi:hypothetical protein